MGVLHWIGRVIANLGDAWPRTVASGAGFRPGSGGAALYGCLFAGFFAIGLVLVLLGFDLNDVDNWLDAQSGWLDTLGDWLVRIVSGLVLLLCALMVGMQIFVRDRAGKPGLGCVVLAVIVAYFAWFGMTENL